MRVATKKDSNDAGLGVFKHTSHVIAALLFRLEFVRGSKMDRFFAQLSPKH
jgi:hypothetical protein